MGIAEQGTQAGLRALHRIAGSELIDRIGMRKTTERLVFNGTRNGFKAANVAGRTFKSVNGAGKQARQKQGKRPTGFDLTPTDEQQMLIEAFGDFASSELRTAAGDADHACEAPAELLAQSTELGITTLGVPEEHGGVVEERSAVTTALVTEALARGDMGIAFAMLAPAAVSTAISLWGNGTQQGTYLPAFTGETPPVAALAIQEPKPLFDPFRLDTTARRDGHDFILSGVKSLVPRAADAELFVIAADLQGSGPALFVVEAKEAGLATRPEPAMGLRAASTAQLELGGVRLGKDALLTEDAGDYADCIRLGRVAWCAMALGTAHGALDFLIPYVNERKAFGEPISHRQAVAFNIADIGIDVESMRLLTYRAASLADQGKDFAPATAAAREMCRTKGAKIGSDAVGLLGGHGYVKEYPVERWYRDLRSAGVIEGALLV